MAERQRSPNYPGFGLPEAILKAKQLYEHDGKSAVPREVAVQAWGYQGLNGASMRALGALRQFGLLEMPTTGTVKVSGDALVLILEPEGSSEWRAAHSSVAMRPAIFRALVKQYPDGLPSDAAVVSFLVRTASFSEDAARIVVASYRDTLTLAKADGDAHTSQNGDEGSEQMRVGDKTPEENPKAKRRDTVAIPDVGKESLDLPFPLVSGGQAVLRIPRYMTEDDYTSLTSLLDVILKGMKSALVSQSPKRCEPSVEAI